MIRTRDINEDKEETFTLRLIPLTWFDTTGAYFLQPPSTFLPGGLSCFTWGHRTFVRSACPNDSWLEFDVFKIETNDKPGVNMYKLNSQCIVSLTKKKS